MAECNSLSAPNQNLIKDMCPKTAEGEKEMSKVPYQKLVVSYLRCKT